jgi:hypothetical protein
MLKYTFAAYQTANKSPSFKVACQSLPPPLSAGTAKIESNEISTMCEKIQSKWHDTINAQSEHVINKATYPQQRLQKHCMLSIVFFRVTFLARFLGFFVLL